MAGTPRQRLLALIAAAAAMVASAPAPLTAEAQTYGTLIARHSAAPAGSLQTSFAHVQPPASFLLVVTEPAKATLELHWTLRCVGSARRESGGASGAALVSSGHWVKRVRADWIEHPTSCSGSLSGSAAASPVLVRVFAD